MPHFRITKGGTPNQAVYAVLKPELVVWGKGPPVLPAGEGGGRWERLKLSHTQLKLTRLPTRQTTVLRMRSLASFGRE